MIVTCPECSTRYLIDQDAIGVNGRTVRCAKCETTWFISADIDVLALQENQTDSLAMTETANSNIQTAPAPAQSPEGDTGSKLEQDVFAQGSASVGAHVIMREKNHNLRRKRRLATVAMIWALPLTILAASALGAYVFRQDIVDNAPRTATLYKTLGVDVSLTGLTIESPVTRSAFVDGKAVLVVNGAVRNISSETRDVPFVELSLHSGSGERLVSWLVDVKVARLKKSGRVTFNSEYPDPPVDAVKLHYKFADEDLTGAQDLQHYNVLEERAAVTDEVALSLD